MSPEKQRVAIAEACPDVAKIDGAGAPVWKFDDRQDFDPLTDLNAMHEAEKQLDGPQWHMYATKIGRHDTKNLLHATASQRCEAFLKTIGRWEEEA